MLAGPPMTIDNGPRPIGDRLRRLLVMLPWLMARGEVPVADMAARFELSEAELVSDLELAALCGLAAFSRRDDRRVHRRGKVFVGLPGFTKPCSSPREGFALLVAARVPSPAGGRPGRAAGASARQAGRDPRWRRSGRRCAATDAAADLAGRSPITRDAGSVLVGRTVTSTEREITPRSIFLDRGNWY